jgi:hypothetical protein
VQNCLLNEWTLVENLKSNFEVENLKKKIRILKTQFNDDNAREAEIIVLKTLTFEIRDIFMALGRILSQIF